MDNGDARAYRHNKPKVSREPPSRAIPLPASDATFWSSSGPDFENPGCDMTSLFYFSKTQAVPHELRLTTRRVG